MCNNCADESKKGKSTWQTANEYEWFTNLTHKVLLVAELKTLEIFSEFYEVVKENILYKIVFFKHIDDRRLYNLMALRARPSN